VNILYILRYLINKTAFQSSSVLSLDMKMVIFILGEEVERGQDMP